MNEKNSKLTIMSLSGNIILIIFIVLILFFIKNNLKSEETENNKDNESTVSEIETLDTNTGKIKDNRLKTNYLYESPSLAEEKITSIEKYQYKIDFKYNFVDKDDFCPNLENTKSCNFSFKLNGKDMNVVIKVLPSQYDDYEESFWGYEVNEKVTINGKTIIDVEGFLTKIIVFKDFFIVKSSVAYPDGSAHYTFYYDEDINRKDLFPPYYFNPGYRYFLGKNYNNWGPTEDAIGDKEIYFMAYLDSVPDYGTYSGISDSLYTERDMCEIDYKADGFKDDDIIYAEYKRVYYGMGFFSEPILTKAVTIKEHYAETCK